MSEKIKIMYMILALGILTIVFYAITVVADKINQHRCYNLPLNEFYEDKSCLKYTEIWEELLGE